MGLLGDIYSTIDSKKRQLKGLLADPVETLKLGLLNFKNDQNALLDTQAQAYPFIPRTQDQQARIPTFARTQEQARKELADQGANMGMAAATVWHGSPHKFDKFDSSKIGTGEGAQAYGHGLYLAESPDVAKSYQALDPVALSAPVRAFKGVELNAGTPEYHAATLLDNMGLQQAKKQVTSWIENADPRMAREVDGWRKTLETLNSATSKSDFKRLKNTGSLYKVDLPDEAIAKMVDYDKPFSSQPKEFRDMLAKYDPETYHPSGSDYDANELGQQTLQRLQKQWGETKVSAVLKGSGIPGIRYLDGGSRGTGSGTSNYVVFPGNEDLLTILERNGQGLLGQ